ncbi:MAG: bifunctional DNA-formamidopyrimidine glycosylase/DNA-(apurinic or apyrimidinic site) lyase [Eubacteriales bacterium]|nr:bifunctional DNA-formamidopyrimidine glycosylase/DNA-(apurinic or apyrimidinic site) lyase [Eubacteriales bacterium]MDD4513429.1 bifunctional DNA-formamidopyrimidine glycosylase/DNA-(apurinic or apyrimidinic site) lyase [Eubacteriales bacterium]
MPELPEVETVKRVLAPQLAGQSILSVTVCQPQIIAYPDAALFSELLTGQTIQSLSRRGKFLTLHMESGDRVVIHLRMTGQLLVTPPDYPLEKHTHLVAELPGGMQIRYIDVRRFGRFWLLKADEADTVTGQDKLGIEPLDDALTGEFLCARLGYRSKPIKEMLHDQTIVAGIGNIYSDEILFEAGIYPGEKCADLDADGWNRLAASIKKIISWGIEVNQLTADEYLAGKGKEYRNMPDLNAYGREGQACARCGSAMEKLIIGGRSSCYCPKCQRKKP